MRRALVALMVGALTLVPLSGAGANDCPELAGSAKLDFGKTLTGKSKLVYEGDKLKVGFVQTSFTPTGPDTFDIEFDWFFPGGTVSIVEHSTVTPLTGPLTAFDSTVEVVAGGSGHWTWSGVANLAAGKAGFDLEGTLCIDP